MTIFARAATAARVAPATCAGAAARIPASSMTAKAARQRMTPGSLSPVGHFRAGLEIPARVDCVGDKHLGAGA